MNNADSDSAADFDPMPHRLFSVADSASKRAALKVRLAKILSASGVKDPQTHDTKASHFTFGVDTLDRALRGNAKRVGLPRAALHELHGTEKYDASSAAAMALLLTERTRHNVPQQSVLWIGESGEKRRQGKLYPPGLAELGIDPASIIHVDAPDSIAVLRAAADGVRASAINAVIVELAGKKPRGLDMTATRRLSLSAQQSGVLTLLLRSGSDLEDPLPTAAFSRWQISSAPSAPLEANAPGHPVFDIKLLRHRSGLYGLSARLEWNREQRQFREQRADQSAPDIGAVPALSSERTFQQKPQAA